MSKFFSAALVGVTALGAGLTAAHAQTAPSSDGGAANKLPPVVVKQKKPAVKSEKAAKSTPPSSAGDTTAAKATAKPKPQSYPQPSPTAAAPAGSSDEAMQPLAVGATGLAVPATTTRLPQSTVKPELTQTSDTARILTSIAGVAAYQAGGVSSLPVINGLNDERVRVVMGGIDVTSACANHMNPPLSYMPPTAVGSVEVVSGVTPVSKGGDSLGGTVIIERADPKFAAPGQTARTSGSVSSFYRSNGGGYGGALSGEAATQNFSMRYDGSFARSGNYDRGGDGTTEVRSTEYQSRNHSVTLSSRGDGSLFTLHAGIQEIPYQGFPNQYMDMGASSRDGILGNDAKEIDVRYKTRLGVGLLEANAFFHHVEHYMNKLDDKGGSTSSTGMPMFTDGKDFGYGIKLELPAMGNSKLRVGNELHLQRYDEWWTPVGTGGMMCCNTFWNINDGRRDRLGTFAEWEAKWSSKWTTLLGARNDVVWMDAGNVQAYNTMVPAYGTDAATFNSRDHSRTDVNFDATAMTRYEVDTSTTLELAYGRKTRSPNLYERYAWSSAGMGGSMAMRMIGWFGDLNGYVGNLDLDPEVANTISFTAAWRGGARKEWGLKVTPYYTYVHDFIDVDTKKATASNVAYLQFANHDAELYGVNVTGDAPLWSSHAIGAFAVTGTLGYVHGERTDGGALYHMMPLNGRLSLTHSLGNWSSAAEVQLVADKDRVDSRRLEPTTSGYALVNLRTSYEWQNVRFDLGVTNLLDKLYYDPLAGRNRELSGALEPLAGMGRSLNAGVTVKF